MYIHPPKVEHLDCCWFFNIINSIELRMYKQIFLYLCNFVLRINPKQWDYWFKSYHRFLRLRFWCVIAELPSWKVISIYAPASNVWEYPFLALSLTLGMKPLPLNFLKSSKFGKIENTAQWTPLDEYMNIHNEYTLHLGALNINFFQHFFLLLLPSPHLLKSKIVYF